MSGADPNRVRHAWSLTTATISEPAASSSGANQRPLDGCRPSTGKYDELTNSTGDCLTPESASTLTVVEKKAAAPAKMSVREAIAR